MRFSTDLANKAEGSHEVAISRARAGYQSRLVVQADEVAALGSRAMEKVALDELARWSHRLHGTAGSFGISSVTDAAEQLSAALKAKRPVQDIKEHAERLASCMRNTLGTDQ